jgi:hypothetical protein
LSPGINHHVLQATNTVVNKRETLKIYDFNGGDEDSDKPSATLNIENWDFAIQSYTGRIQDIADVITSIGVEKYEFNDIPSSVVSHLGSKLLYRVPHPKTFDLKEI